jgi:type IV secretory pathway VirB10-like protein
MTKLLTAFTNHFHTTITIIFVLIVLYIVRYPYYLEFYFENTLGRAALILFIVAMTYCNPMLGALATVAFIGLYNSRVIEGFDANSKKIEIVAREKKPEPKTTEAPTSSTPTPLPTASADDKKPDPPIDKSSEPTVVQKENAQKENAQKDNANKDNANKEAFHNMTLSPADLNEGRNRMLTIEDYIRMPKFSNQMSFSKYYESSAEPSANYSGTEGMQSGVALAN